MRHLFYRASVPWPIRLFVFVVVALLLAAAVLMLWFVLVPMVVVGLIVFAVMDAKDRRR